MKNCNDQFLWSVSPVRETEFYCRVPDLRTTWITPLTWITAIILVTSQSMILDYPIRIPHGVSSHVSDDMFLLIRLSFQNLLLWTFLVTFIWSFAPHTVAYDYRLYEHVKIYCHFYVLPAQHEKYEPCKQKY